MRVALIGGTRFTGPAIVEELLDAGHEPLVIHRGHIEPDDLPEVAHAHLDRHDVAALRDALHDHRPDAIIDTVAYSRHDAETAVAAIPEGTRTVVLSSQDVYRAFHRVRAGLPGTEPVPIREEGPVRGPDERFMFRGETSVPGGVDPQTYENLDVEDVYLPTGAVVLRLPMVYGERDHVRREEFVLRRVRAGRERIPFGRGAWLWTRAWVRDVARAVRLATESVEGGGRPYNVGEATTETFWAWAQRILAAAEHDAELVEVADEVLPEDLSLTGTSVSQHVLTDSGRLRATFGWEESGRDEAVTASVRWHLAHPPPDPDEDLSADDAALATVG